MNVIDILKYGDNTLMSALERFPAAQQETTGACGWWSVKDIIAHMTANEIYGAEALDSVVTGAAMPSLARAAEHGAEWNDIEVRARSERATEEIVAEYREAHARLLGFAAQIPAKTFRENGRLPWYGPTYCLDDFLVYTNYAHKREHAGQIDVFGDRFR